MSETMRCSWCGKDVDPEGHRWECTGNPPEPTLRERVRAEMYADLPRQSLYPNEFEFTHELFAWIGSLPARVEAFARAAMEEKMKHRVRRGYEWWHCGDDDALLAALPALSTPPKPGGPTGAFMEDGG